MPHDLCLIYPLSNADAVDELMLFLWLITTYTYCRKGGELKEVPSNKKRILRMQQDAAILVVTQDYICMCYWLSHFNDTCQSHVKG